jgi:hypothetical protein
MRMLLACLLLSACAGREQVIVEKPVEVKVPVTVPCVKLKPDEPVALQTTIGRQAWDAMTTDQREKLLNAQAMRRKSFGDKLTVATAGCL